MRWVPRLSSDYQLFNQILDCNQNDQEYNVFKFVETKK